ncbi:MAG: glycoside hydrolase family 26 protein [Saccharofermentans sp.]|nr:glycoside hydrolase family 26 protein [Saccharofermentans sp.]
MGFKYKRSGKLENLLNVLRDFSLSDQILFGQQNAGHIGVSITAADGTESDCRNLCGRHPAVVGIDTLSFTGYEGNLNDLITVVKNLRRQGIIITLSSHMPNFSLGGDEFYDYSPNITEGDCGRRILPGGDLNAKYRRFLDMIADFAERCVDVEGEKIPMIFRPFHECNGDWFWWGKAYLTDEEYIELFRYTIDYLMDQKGVDNLAIAYSPNGPVTGEKEYLARYPGDEYIDILGLDYYHDKPHKGDGFSHRLSSSLEVIDRIAEERGKITALTETGYRSLETENGYFEGLAPMDNTVKDWFTQLLDAITSTESGKCIAFMLIWANFSDTQFWLPFATEDFRHEMCDDFIKFAEDPRVKMAPVFDFDEQV